MGRAVTIALVGMAITACGRYGFEIVEGDVAFSAEDPIPFGGAVPTGVQLSAGGATLANADELLTMPTVLPSAVMAAAACGHDEHVFIAGGSPGYTGNGCSDQILEYDPGGGSLALAQTTPSAYRGAGLVLHPDGNLYSVMGYCGSAAEEKMVYGFDPGGIGIQQTGSFIEGAFHTTAAVLPDQSGEPLIVAVGGFGTGPLRDSVQTMDPRDGSAAILSTRLPTHRCMATSAVVDDVMYVIGGNAPANLDKCEPGLNTNNPQMTDEIIAVELWPERVEVVGNLPYSIAGACAVARQDGTILIFGGARYLDPDGDGSYRREPTDEIVSFDPATGSVTTLTMTLPEPLSGVACASTASGRIIVMGGYGSDGTARDGIMFYAPYVATGTLLGPVIDSERPDARWVSAFWQAEEPDGTSVVLYVRVGATDGWDNDTDGWVLLETPGLLPEVLPRGRYMQWRAVLDSPDQYRTPTLTEVTLHFQGR